MSELVTKVAKAMCERAGTDWSDTSADEYSPPLMNRSFWIQEARAAIEAMRELPGEPGPRYTAGEYSRRTQEAMVDDALS